jgi:TPR repeat protein
MKTPLTFLLSLTFLFLFSGSVYGDDLQDGVYAYYGDDFQDGVYAYQRKDYKEAIRLWKPLAEQGDADAQYNLGLMYDHGQGVPQDYKEGVRLYRLSAEQGNTKGQYNLGFMYAKGTGVLQDYALAHMWFNLSGSNGNKGGVKNRNIIEKRMSPSQIEKAQEMARNWKPTTK